MHSAIHPSTHPSIHHTAPRFQASASDVQAAYKDLTAEQQANLREALAALDQAGSWVRCAKQVEKITQCDRCMVIWPEDYPPRN